MGEKILPIHDQDKVREILKDRRKMYENDWDDILENEIRRQFTVREVADRIHLMLDPSMNIFRRIVREICTVYKEGATRTLGKSAPDRLVDIYKAMKIDSVMMEAHRVAKASSVCFLFPRLIPGTERIIVSLIPPDIAHLRMSKDDPLEIEAFAYFTEGKDQKGRDVKCWVYYDTDHRYFLNEAGEKIPNPFSGDGSEENKYGIIPIIPFPCAPPVNGYIRPNWSKDAYKANLIIGVLNTYMNDLVKTQSFKQPVFTGDGLEESLKNQTLDAMAAITLPTGATATVLDLNTQLAAVDAVIRGKVMAIANNYGISNENFTVSGQVASGFSLKVANHALEEIRASDIPLCADVESALYRVIARINNTELPGKTLPEDGEFTFNPGEVEFPATWDETERQWRFEIELGAANAVDYLVWKDPQITREAAEKKLSQINDENSRVGKKKSLLEELIAKKE